MTIETFRLAHPRKIAAAGGTECSYTSGGSGNPKFLLIPGGLGSSDSLFPLIESLEPIGHVIAVSYPSALSSVRQFTHALCTVLDREDVRSAFVIGSSFGGWVAQEFAKRHRERTQGLVLIHSFTVSPEEKRRIRRVAPVARTVLSLMPRRLLDAAFRQRVNAILLNPLRAAGHADIASWERLAVESSLREMAATQLALLAESSDDSSFKRFDGPVMIVESDNDPAVKRASREALKRAYPHATVVHFSGMGHVSSILATAEVTARVRQYIDASSPDADSRMA